MKIFTGIVVSTKMSKTATVAVTRIVQHPVYNKRTRVFKKYQVHDEVGVKVGDKVKFVTSKPYSKLKKWKIIEEPRDKKVSSVNKPKQVKNKKIVKQNKK